MASLLNITRQNILSAVIIKSRPMKKISYLFISIAFCCNNVYGNLKKSPDPASDSIIVFTTPDIKDLVTGWTRDYSNSSPGKAIGIRTIAAAPEELLTRSGDILFADEGNAPTLNDRDFRIVVGRNIVVPVINSSNPYLTEILSKGISPEMIRMIIEGSHVKWGDILNGVQDRLIRIHYLNDPLITNALLDFTGSGKANMIGQNYMTAGEMLSEIAKDDFSVGFCRLSDLQDKKVSLLPIDKNGNGTIDSNEDIYSDMQAFTRGVWIGKYPKELYNDIFSISGTPVSANVAAFLNWIITDGQKTLSAEGYSELILTERISHTGKLTEAMAGLSSDTGGPDIFKSLLVVILILSGGIVITGFIVTFRKKNTVAVKVIPNADGMVLDEKSILLPKGMYFDKTHTWAFMEQDGNVKVGVDDFLLHMTGQVNRIKMKKTGDRVKKGDEILTIVNNGKQLHLYSPVSGVIKELNAGLESNVELLNSAPYSNGWVYRVEPDNWQRENQLLFMADKHRQFIQNEIAKIRDFLASLLHNENMQLSPLILQDGGSLRQGILSEMGPEVWEEFQTRIIDPSRTVWFYEII